MAEKRKRGRPPGSTTMKKRQSILEDDTPTKASSPAPSAHSRPLLSRINDSKALPTVTRNFTGPPQALQSIFESGVLEASLKKSRNAWLSENLFELYWTKPTKKKGQQENPNNPAKESMQKIGHCRITIEPHVFHASLFSIRKWPPPIAKADGPDAGAHHASTVTPTATPLYPTTSLGSFNGIPTTPTSFERSPNVQPTQPTQFPSTTSQAAPLGSTSITVKSTPTAPTIPSPVPIFPSQNSTNLPPLGASPTTFVGPSISPITPKPTQDPVIQMLAQRASINPDLKILMKIVAAGNASPEQLKVFQSHIDELTAILHRQNQANQFVNIAPQGFSLTSSVSSSSFRPPPPPPALNFAQQTPKFQVPSLVKAKPVLPPKNDIFGVAIEFSGTLGERFLFPKNSILETSTDGKELLASFLIVRKLTQHTGKSQENGVEYHQPVTIRLNADHSRVFDSIYKTVAPVEEVRKSMENIMNTTSAAEAVRLVMQLPKKPIENTQTPPVPTPSSVSNSAQKIIDTSKTEYIATSGGTGRPSRRRSDDLDQRCQHCFAAVPSNHAWEGSQPVCTTCLNLQAASGTRVARPARRMPLHTKAPAGPKALTFAGEAY